MTTAKPAKPAGQPPLPRLPGFPADPHQAAGTLLGLLLGVADAQYAHTSTYCQTFLEADGTDAQRRTIASQAAAAAQRDLDYARAVLDAYRLQADMTREDHQS